MKALLIFTTLALGLQLRGQDTTVSPLQKDGYTLVWADEFNEDGPIDSEKWRFEKGFVRNKELQWYQEDNAWCENGYLLIEGRREQRPNPRYKKESSDWKSERKYIHYTSSSINTQGLYDFQYGILEVRAKVSNLPGTWPAIWTLGSSCEWPSNGEVDIMENYGGGLLANFAWGSNKRWTAIWDSATKPVSDYPESWIEDFHVWKMIWTESRMSIYVDDLLLNETDLSKTINGSYNCEGDNPFQQPHYILLNLAIGGQQGGDPSHSPFPNRYLVDYVRVYQAQ